MRIAVLTANEPLYLPGFFDRFLQKRAGDVAAIFPCQPVYKNHTKYAMFRRYLRTFGLCNTALLTWRVLRAKIADRLRIGLKERRFCSIASVGKHYDVPVHVVRDVNAPEFIEQLRSMEVDLILSVSCPQVFKAELISLPEKGCLNLHGADLPKYRGIMPSFWMLANDEKQAGVTIFFVSPDIDIGQTAGKRLFPIAPDDTLHSLIVRSKQHACDLALETLDQIEAGTAQRRPQEGKGSYFGWPTREAYRKFRKLGRRLWWRDLA